MVRSEDSITISKPYLHRRTKSNKKSVIEFIARLDEAVNSRDRRCIVNADETSWPVVFANRKTWHKSTEEKTQHSDVVEKVDANLKSAFTVMASVTANADTLPYSCWQKVKHLFVKSSLRR
jgi:hypothetical protein